jgi:hypothetical protein
MVPLNIPETVPLPIVFPKALNGKNLVVVPNGTGAVRGAITARGRKAKVAWAVKRKLIEKYPNIFLDENGAIVGET